MSFLQFIERVALPRQRSSRTLKTLSNFKGINSLFRCDSSSRSPPVCVSVPLCVRNLVESYTWHNFATLQHCNIASLHPCNIETLHHCNIATLQLCNFSTLQFFNFAKLQLCNNAISQHCKIAKLQLCNSATLQHC